MAAACDDGSENNSRVEIHRRSIECVAYRRDDALWDFEITLVDRKTQKCDLPEKNIPAGEPIHHMTVRVAVDANCTIRDVEAKTLASPYEVCGQIGPVYKALIGEQIGPRFGKLVKTAFGKAGGCTHISELLPNVATTVYQSFATESPFQGDQHAAAGAKLSATFGVSPLGSCHALRPDGEVVAKYFSPWFGDKMPK